MKQINKPLLGHEGVLKAKPRIMVAFVVSGGDTKFCCAELNLRQ